MSNVLMLDTTLRDGGLGLEDANLKGLSSMSFSHNDKTDIANTLSKAAIDIVEVGSLELSKEDKTRFAIYQGIEEISKTIVSPGRQMHAALYRGPDTPLQDIPDWREGLCELVRVIIRYSELKKSLDYCAALSAKGYKVCVQPMLTMRYTPEEIQQIIAAANEMNAYALYFVDSYGYMDENDVLRFLKTYDERLKPSIKVGFHAHNNSNLAFSNVKVFLANRGDRDVIVDSCLMGLGQGAGNMQTEILADYLNKTEGKSYDYGAVLDGCEIVEKFYESNLCGYSVTYLLPALHKAAYKYAVDMRRKHRLSYAEINRVFEYMPNDLKQRYTPDNLRKALVNVGYNYPEY